MHKIPNITPKKDFRPKSFEKQQSSTVKIADDGGAQEPPKTKNTILINVPNLNQIVEEEKKEIVEEENKEVVKEEEKVEESKSEVVKEATEAKTEEQKEEEKPIELTWEEKLSWEEIVQSKGSQNCFRDESIVDSSLYADICGKLSQADFRYIWSVLQSFNEHFAPAVPFIN